jgi:hypothetical protein
MLLYEVGGDCEQNKFILKVEFVWGIMYVKVNDADICKGKRRSSESLSKSF